MTSRIQNIDVQPESNQTVKFMNSEKFQNSKKSLRASKPDHLPRSTSVKTSGSLRSRSSLAPFSAFFTPVITTFFALSVTAFTALTPTNYVLGKAKRSNELSVEIKNKLYPKNKKIEVAADFGGILNQSYISSQLVHLSATYFSSESFGFGADFSLALNSDKAERTCVENFYNDPEQEVTTSVCAKDGDPATAADDLSNPQGPNPNINPNMGPAYPPIRELNYLISGYANWAPIYGKQLFFMSGVVHFDLFFTAGAGVAMSDFYPEKKEASDGRLYRGPYPATGTSDVPPGIDPTDEDEYGINGRPKPEAQTTPLITFGVGQKFHFTKNLNLRMEFRNYTLVGTDDIFETYFAVWGGLGLRF